VNVLYAPMRAHLLIIGTSFAILAVTSRGNNSGNFVLFASAESPGSNTRGATGVLVTIDVAILLKDTSRDCWAASHDISGDAAVTVQR
jgi:hypothetical protein